MAKRSQTSVLGVLDWLRATGLFRRVRLRAWVQPVLVEVIVHLNRESLQVFEKALEAERVSGPTRHEEELLGAAVRRALESRDGCPKIAGIDLHDQFGDDEAPPRAFYLYLRLLGRGTGRGRRDLGDRLVMPDLGPGQLRKYAELTLMNPVVVNNLSPAQLAELKERYRADRSGSSMPAPPPKKWKALDATEMALNHAIVIDNMLYTSKPAGRPGYLTIDYSADFPRYRPNLESEPMLAAADTYWTTATTLSALAAHLNQHGFRPPYGRASFTEASVRSVVIALELLRGNDEPDEDTT